MYNSFIHNPDLVDLVIMEEETPYLYTFSLRCFDEYRTISNKLSDVKITSKVIKRNTFIKCLNKESYGVLTKNRVKLFEISAVKAVNMKLRESGNLKRRKAIGATKRKAPEEQLPVPKGTTVEHYLQLISDTWTS
ncbi:hypothetical protein K501DRAFT_272118 [Backusella circina FSU 941]|nr:hypothetical protein K501DRAFT_272118 [Backusella circina FSU 941]